MSTDHNLARSKHISRNHHSRPPDGPIHECGVCKIVMDDSIGLEDDIGIIFVCLGCIRQAAKLAGLT